MTSRDLIVGIVLDDAGLTLEQIAGACAVDRTWVVTHVSEGYLPVVGDHESDWHFTAAALNRARRMRAIERDFDAVPELAALVADMLDEMDALRTRLNRGGLS